MARNHMTKVAGAIISISLAFPIATAGATVDRTPGIEADGGLILS